MAKMKWRFQTNWSVAKSN